MMTTLQDFVTRNLETGEKFSVLGVMSNTSQVSVIEKYVNHRLSESKTTTIHIDNPESLVDIEIPLNLAQIDETQVVVVGLLFDVFDIHWSKILSETKKLEQAEKQNSIILIYNIYQVDSVYNVIPNLKEITTQYFNHDVQN